MESRRHVGCGRSTEQGRLSRFILEVQDAGGCPGWVHSSFHHPPPLASFVSLIPRRTLEEEAGSWGFLLSLSASSALFSPQALFQAQLFLRDRGRPLLS